MLIPGKMIRMGLDNLRIIGRTTQGVTLINLEEGERVVAMDILAQDDSTEDGDLDELGSGSP